MRQARCAGGFRASLRKGALRSAPHRGAGAAGIARIALALVAAWSLVAGLTPVIVSARASASLALLRDPYLTDVTGSTAMVNFATGIASPLPVVTWGPVSNGCSAPANQVTAIKVTSFTGAARTTDYQFKAPLTGLAANTSYCYHVSQSGTDLLGGTAPVFRSALAGGATDAFSFAVVGDFGAGTTDESKVLGQIAAARPSFIATVGDNAYPSGSQGDYGDLNGGNVFAPPYWPKVGRTTPVFPAQGNHGFTVNAPYLQNWPQDATVAACASSGCRYQQDTYCCTATLGTSNYTYASSWYAFDWGNSRFYILEGGWSDKTGGYQGDFDAHFNGAVSGCSVCGTELTMLQGDLAGHSAAHKFAFFHYPLYADSSSQPSDGYLDGSSRLEGVLASGGVHIVFNGHAHQYERNYPQISGNPMVSYVTGGGGDPLGSVSGQSSFDADAQAIFHYLLVTVNGSTVTVTPTDENGNTFDVQSYTFGATTTGDFSISANPTSVGVTAGQSGGSTISTSVTSGSAQTVALSASGIPAGAQASFNPSSVTAGSSSTMTISTSSSTPAGTYTVTVTGTGTSATHSTSVTLTVAAATATNDFSLAATPTTLSVMPGSGGSSTISTTLTSGSAEQVTLSVTSALPSGVTATFGTNPISSSGGTSTLSLGTAASTPPGTYPITVQGAATSATHTVTVTLVVGSTGPQFVQAAGATESGAATTLTAGFANATGAGHLLVLSAGVYTGATNQISAVTDSAGNTWTKIGAWDVSGHYSDGEMWYSAGAAPVTGVTVTLGSAAVVAMEVEEFSGVATSNPVDADAGTSNTSTSADSGPATPAASSDLAVGMVAGHGNAQAITVTAPGFTALSQQTSTNAGSTPTTVVSGYQLLGSTASQDFTGSFASAMYWAAGVVLFRSA